jgi:hypothetical protein
MFAVAVKHLFVTPEAPVHWWTISLASGGLDPRTERGSHRFAS